MLSLHSQVLILRTHYVRPSRHPVPNTPNGVGWRVTGAGHGPPDSPTCRLESARHRVTGKDLSSF
eukprot:9113390-Pyramimonas_sp.AAC.1